MLDIKFPDGSVKQFENGITPFEIAKSISNSLAKNILSASLNEITIELSPDSITFFAISKVPLSTPPDIKAGTTCRIVFL